jgi:hypothetical protein
MSEDNLTKDDLVLLMESYRNMITLHQTILDQSGKTIEKIDDMLTKQDKIYGRQKSTCDILNRCADNLEKTCTNIQTHTLESVKDHGKIINKIHVGWIGMASIILSLVGMFFVVGK